MRAIYTCASLVHAKNLRYIEHAFLNTHILLLISGLFYATILVSNAVSRHHYIMMTPSFFKKSSPQL
ncbi:hypothetical protein J6TS1_24240 [Siminovitchia terrae]|uniref:Uncharacterized protein n=1 Tax=Siminovitchia terrae TaxID=1914933 RepID=A0ABQ4KXZ6_SIMTE|nr:hypothetical protein J6TS1_24240 [Siminovitchia terrae]